MNAQMAIQHVLHDLPGAATATFLALFPIVNPLGGVPMFFSLTADYARRSPSHRVEDRSRCHCDPGCLYAFWPLRPQLLRHFAAGFKDCGRVDRGEHGVGHGDRLQPHDDGGKQQAMTKEDISLTPMAMPMLSGPGSIGVVMGLAAHADHFLSYVGMIVGIVALGLSCYLCLCLGGPFVKRLGPGAMGAINRIFGFLILAIAVQLVWNGAADFRV